MDITAVVVTYNRLTLLSECLDSFLQMTKKPSNVIVVDNASTDGTSEYLEKLSMDSLFSVVSLEKNIGGSGGFYTGIRKAVEDGADWVWVMDDDTIPQADTLERLVEVVEKNPDVGFLSSRVNWIDGNPVEMNKQEFLNKGEGLDKVDDAYQRSLPNLRPVRSASFVSLLINARAIREVGLPYKEFFIWCDDAEYTKRIVAAGYNGWYVADSVVVHKTAVNYGPNIITAPVEQAWKFYYKMRNEIFLKRKEHGNVLMYYIHAFNQYRLELHRIKKRQDGNQNCFREKIKQGFWDGLRFRPTINYV